MPNVISKTPRRRFIGVALTLAVGALATLLQAGGASATSPIVHRVTAGTPDACRTFDLKPG